jgi:hypothetical protein
MSKVAILGDSELCCALAKEVAEAGHTALTLPADLSTEDEWAMRRWFLEEMPEATLLCIGLKGHTNVSNFQSTVIGGLNVIRAAVGASGRLLVVSTFMSADFVLMESFERLLRFEKKLPFESTLPVAGESKEGFLRRCVLTVLNVSAKETNADGAKGPEQGREVRDQVVSESSSIEQHRLPAEAVLEVSVAPAAAAVPGDVRVQHPAPACSCAPDTLHADAGAISGVVPPNELPGKSGAAA